MNLKNKALALALVSFLVLAVTLIGMKLLGVDVVSALFGSPWVSWRPDDRVAKVLEGLLAAVVILFGSLFTAGMIALLADRPKAKPAENKAESQEASK